jgi:hypothetical protein
MRLGRPRAAAVVAAAVAWAATAAAAVAVTGGLRHLLWRKADQVGRRLPQCQRRTRPEVSGPAGPQSGPQTLTQLTPMPN